MSFQTFGKSVLRVAKNYTKGYSDVQAKVREATSNDPWGPSGTQMHEIAQLTYNQNDFFEIMEMLDKRLNDKAKNWRHVFKSLTVVDYLLHSGSENVIVYFRDNIDIVKTLKEVQYIDEFGKDQGANVRQKAKDITNLLMDEARLRQQRLSHRSGSNMRDRMMGQTGDDDNDEPLAVRGDENSARRTRGAGGEDELRRAIEESKRSLTPDQEGADLASAIKLSEEEEARRKATVTDSSSLFDEPNNNLIDLQGQNNGLQPQFTVQPQLTSFNPYQQQAQQEAMTQAQAQAQPPLDADDTQHVSANIISSSKSSSISASKETRAAQREGITNSGTTMSAGSMQLPVHLVTDSPLSRNALPFLSQRSKRNESLHPQEDSRSQRTLIRSRSVEVDHTASFLPSVKPSTFYCPPSPTSNERIARPRDEPRNHTASVQPPAKPSTALQPLGSFASLPPSWSPSLHGPKDASAAPPRSPVDHPTSQQINGKQNPSLNGLPPQPAGVSGRSRRVPEEDDDSEGSTGNHAKPAAPGAPSRNEIARLEDGRLIQLERQLSETVVARTKQDQHIRQLTDELALKSSLLAQVAEEKKRAGLELCELQTKLDESLVSRDHALQQAQSALHKASCAAEANEQSQRKLTEMSAELEERRSELAAFRLRLANTENVYAKSKAEASTYSNQNETGLVNTEEDRVVRGLMERIRALEAEVASLRWNEKSFETMEIRNED